MDYNEYYDALKYYESILRKKTSLDFRGFDKKPTECIEDAQYHAGLTGAINAIEKLLVEVKKAESRADTAERERDELKALLSQAQENAEQIETIFVKEDLEIGPIYDIEGSIMEKATNAIYRELVPRLNEFVECRVKPDYGRMATPVVCAKISLVRPERKKRNG